MSFDYEDRMFSTIDHCNEEIGCATTHFSGAKDVVLGQLLSRENEIDIGRTLKDHTHFIEQ